MRAHQLWLMSVCAKYQQITNLAIALPKATVLSSNNLEMNKPAAV